MSIRIITTVFIGIFLLTGCYTLNQIGEPVDQGIEITNMEKATPVSHFERDETITHFLWGLVSPANAEVEQIIAKEVQRIGGTRAVNIRMKYQMTFVNGLLNLLTLGIYNPFTLTIEGDVIK